MDTWVWEKALGILRPQRYRLLRKSKMLLRTDREFWLGGWLDFFGSRDGLSEDVRLDRIRWRGAKLHLRD